MSDLRAWHSVSAGVVERELGTSASSGLTLGEARSRRSSYGPNLIRPGRRQSPLIILLSQFQDFMVLVLLGATAVSAFLGEYRDVVAILAIVILNAILGFVQEFRAERALEALRRLSAPRATVLRDGRAEQVDAVDLVPGDVIILSPGDRIPADARLVECHGLEVDESVLTGESKPVRKDASDIVRQSAPVVEHKNMLHAGTVVTRGRAVGLVVATGMETEMGRIAGMIGDVTDGDTPLQRRLSQLGRWLVAGCLMLCALVAGLGVARGESVELMFLAGVSLAVAAIPEGLPAIVTVSLALGVQRMSARKAIVRKLSAVETLGCATVICADKTGTLTQNQMTVVEIDLIGRNIQVTGSGYSPEGEFSEGGEPVYSAADRILQDLLVCAGLCNDASLVRQSAEERATGGPGRGRAWQSARARGWDVVGDPTEGALLAMAYKGGREIIQKVRSFMRIAEVPFEPERRMMAVACSGPSGVFTFVKGAPQVVLELCENRYLGGHPEGGTAPRDRRFDGAVLARNSAMASQSMRVLAMACAPGNLIDRVRSGQARDLPGLTFLGMVGMMDPPRPEVGRSVALAKQAGIATLMITGDHAATAEAIAKQVGIMGHGRRIITGEELDAMGDRQFEEAVSEVAVFARVAPAHKLRIVRALRAQGHVVAVTGDGVNDAPAIREADIGIAMGRMGTDVAREASSMVLSDDNYATIIAAIEEGRSIYDNIRKFIRYLLACNVGEVLTMLLAVAAGLPLPLTPIQILWMNLMTDGLPAMALAADPTDPNTMQRAPRNPKEGIFSRGLGLKMAADGVFISLCTIACYILAGVLFGHDLETARTMAFCTLVMSQLVYVFRCRVEGRVSSGTGDSSRNTFLFAAVGLSVGLQIFGVHHDLGRAFLGTRTLSLLDWALVLFLSGWSTFLASAARAAKRALERRFTAFRVRKAGETR